MTTTLLAIAAGLATLALVVLLTPARVHLVLRWHAPAGPEITTRIRWGIVRWSVQTGETPPADSGAGDGAASGPDAHAAPRDEPANREGATRRRRRRTFHPWPALRTPGFPSRIVRLVRGILHVALPRRAVVRGEVGLDDPADLGILYGLAAGLAAGVSHAPTSWDVHVDPVFDGDALDLDAELDWSVSAAQVLWPAARFAASPVTWRAVRAGLRGR